jgi:excinuclease ABC subunit C
MPDRAEGFHPGEVPPTPGVYIFRNRFGQVIYVGKASNLRRRLSHYFQPSQARRADPKLRSLINSIHSWEYQLVRTEDESLILESRLIKQYAPRYNVLMRDDKRYLMAKINMNDPWPRFEFARLRKDDGALYFGPFPQGGALRETIEYLTVHFGLRSCSVPEPGPEVRKHCLKRIVKDCSRPCDGSVTQEQYRALAEKMMAVIQGDISELVTELEGRMKEQAAAARFERAAKTRDVITNLKQIFGQKTRSFAHASIAAPPGEEAVTDLQQALGMKFPPDHIECFDNSNLMGTYAVSSAVCFVNGRPARDRYRRFRVKTVDQIDDFATMREVLTRHYSRKMAENQPPPSLIVIDGGKGQLSAALTALLAIGYPPVPVIGLAKRNEEVFLPGREEPIVIDKHRPALRMLQALRDEAHRFAISYHRQLRLRRVQESLLDDIPGIGENRKKSLLRAFGSVRALRKAEAEEIAARVPGIGHAFAETIVDYLKNHRT